MEVNAEEQKNNSQTVFCIFDSEFIELFMCFLFKSMLVFYKYF